ncbi:CsgG/HfaB family protein [Thalassococcus profundi]|jgi:curli production assembly/transport component CsgG|uniref:CsgG/HfaB family protein n=1 Tax=Thalassococcus profundi TaxID=2282382 RepID=UPI0040599522
MIGRINTVAAMGLSLLTLAGCETTLQETFNGTMPASVGYMTAQNRALRDVPRPAQRVTVAVYDFEDLTGQYKDDNAQTLSRAVTQGGSDVLIKALLDAGERRWFSVLDRSELDDVLRERQIITEMRRIYRAEETIDPGVLPPLAHSGIILQGGIIGYDTNTMTGGYGARYLGIGGDRQWKLDVATVSLRAISTKTGEVLASVVARKPIASVGNRGSVFTYVALDGLLEGEAGQTTNEPKQVAIEQATEKAVMALIAEGAAVGLWHFADRSAGSTFIAGYLRQKFDGQVSVDATRPQGPSTVNASYVPQTVPRPRARPAARVIERRVPPTQETEPEQEPPARPPNTPDSDEVIGDVREKDAEPVT